MKKEEKELLFKDLCARLPYMPKIKITYQQQGIKGTDEGNVSCDFIEKIVNDLRNGVITDMQIYLRPMSSMTEEEFAEYEKANDLDTLDSSETLRENMKAKARVRISKWYHGTDWLNAHHFDYRGLIEKGLAIAVTKKNNPYEKE